MKKLVFIFALSFFLLNTAHAQLGFLKKKKDKDPAAADSTKPVAKSEEPEKKKTEASFRKMVGSVAKVAGNSVGSMSGMVTSVDNLNDADIIVSVGTNIYSKDLGLIVTDFLGKDWINNGDFTMLQLASKRAYQTCKYSGLVKVNGKELKHVSMGVHTATENPGTGPKRISFEKNGVEEGSFEVPVPAKNIKLVAVNGQSKNAKIDFSKEVVLELENYSTGPDALVRVDVVGTIMGIRSLYMVCYIKPADKVIIPAAAFRNIETTNKGVKFKDCYMAVSDQQLVKVMNRKGNIPADQMAVTGSNDGIWIDVSGSEPNSEGFKIMSGNSVTEKKNAAYAPPLSFAKNVAVSSFFTYGTTYLYDVSTNHWNQMQTTKTLDFPEIPDSYLDKMLDDLYKKLTTTFSSITGSNVMPAETIPGVPAYENTKKFFPGEVNDDSKFLKVYKHLDPTQSLTSISSRYYGENALLHQSNTDALLKVSLICQLSWDSKPQMTPYLTIELVGVSNGDFRSYSGNTKYFTMNIKGESYTLKKKEPVDFDKIFQVDQFTEAFRNALTELKVKEGVIKDYEQIWKLQH